MAADIVAATESWTFFVTTGFDGFMLGLGVAGMAPCRGALRGLLEVATASIMRLVSLGYLWSFGRICAAVHMQEGNPSKKVR